MKRSKKRSDPNGIFDDSAACVNQKIVGPQHGSTTLQRLARM
ncbi:hypothetical protein [Lignipirellula cremea]|nr:hypothetical protein [Lignipirellula cremea]